MTWPRSLSVHADARKPGPGAFINFDTVHKLDLFRSAEMALLQTLFVSVYLIGVLLHGKSYLGDAYKGTECLYTPRTRRHSG